MTLNKAVQIEGLSFSYPDGTLALDKVSFKISEGEKVGIVGPNGAGKSTLLLHLNGIIQGDGSVYILGMKVEKKNLKAIRQKVGLVFQNPDDQLFCPTVFDDVAFGPRNLGWPENEVSRKVKESLEAVGLEGVEGKSAFHLSFGQKKRLAIATVLSMNSEILALDEPTSNLDPRGRKATIELLDEIDCTLMVVTHDLEIVRRLCDRVIVLHKGNCVAAGKVEEILADTVFLESYGLI